MDRKFIQVNCREGKSIDLRQANAIKRYHPRIVLLEYPNNDRTTAFSFNKYSAKRKPLRVVRKIQDSLKRVARKNPWVLSDVQMWENIISEWGNGNNLLVYKVDGPTDLVSSGNVANDFRGIPHHIKWWVRIYLREQFMLKNTQYILRKHPKENTLVFLQSFHWNNVEFLLNDPLKSDVWDRYFGRFRELNRAELEKKIKYDKTLLKYWNNDLSLGRYFK